VTLVCIALASIAYCIDSETKNEKSIKNQDPQASTMKRLVLHFSPKRNLSCIYDTKTTSSTIPILCGLKLGYIYEKPTIYFKSLNIYRSISCFVVLFFHTLYFGFFAMQNKADLFRICEEPYYQFLQNGVQLVDVFFVISGFLMSFKFLKNRTQMEQIQTDGVEAVLKRFGRTVLQRYLR
jgi:hypothetical protein